jgi:hypothetical protein
MRLIDSNKLHRKSGSSMKAARVGVAWRRLQEIRGKGRAGGFALF